MDNCIFCKIINKEIPCYKIYEDEDVLSFLDITQGTIGHTLILPKKHFANIHEIDEETLSKVMKIVKIVADSVSKLEGVKGVNILNNNGEVAGQSVQHLHFHVIPRYDQEELNLSFAHPNKLTEEEFNKLKESIIKNIG